jgi:hypothetical protein
MLLVAAMTASGALRAAAAGLIGVGPPTPLSAAATLAGIGTLAGVLLAGPGEGRPLRWARAGLGGLAAVALATASWRRPELGAVLGTAVLATAAGALVLAQGRPTMRALAWTLLAAAGVRLLLVDLPGGRPLPLFLGLMSFGGALLAAQRLRPDQTIHSAHPDAMVEPAREEDA